MLKFSGFLTVQLNFPTNCLQILTAYCLKPDQLRTVGIFTISLLVCELYAKEEFFFLQCSNSVWPFFEFFALFKEGRLEHYNKMCRQRTTMICVLGMAGGYIAAMFSVFPCFSSGRGVKKLIDSDYFLQTENPFKGTTFKHL